MEGAVVKNAKSGWAKSVLIKMRCQLKKIALLVLAISVAISCYIAYLLILKRLKPPDEENSEHILPVLKKKDGEDQNPWGLEFMGHENHEQSHDEEPIDWQKDFGMRHEDVEQQNDGQYTVEIWGKAAISIYLWEHIIGGELEAKMGGVWSYGKKTIGNILFRFRTGPGVVPAKVPHNVENLVLVLNGREKSKVHFARMWLDYLPNFQKLRRVAVVLLGNEKCENKWIKEYMTLRGGIVNMVFLVYDSPDVDDKFFFQWPLGVATYRNFPHVNTSTLALQDSRPFQCNFLGTVYKNSSRETLLRVIRDHQLTQTCYINPRLHWLPSETSASLDKYVRALGNSDLTLNPVGQNTECYRIYEAMSFGSVPVIEDQRTPGYCSMNVLRLLKQYNAPVLWIKHWSELPEILKKENDRTKENLAKRRRDVIDWYNNFKNKTRYQFTNVISKQFFGDS